MKKIGLIVKEVSENRIKNTLKDSYAMFIIKYSGLSSPDISALRLVLRKADAKLFVAKNSVARRALKDSGLEPLVKSIDGPCGLIFVKEEPVGASKVLYNFYKDHNKLVLEAGVLKDKIIEKKDIEAMSKLPSKEALRAQAVCTLNAPIAGLAIALNQILVKFVICVDQIRQKKGSQ